MSILHRSELVNSCFPPRAWPCAPPGVSSTDVFTCNSFSAGSVSHLPVSRGSGPSVPSQLLSAEARDPQTDLESPGARQSWGKSKARATSGNTLAPIEESFLISQPGHWLPTWVLFDFPVLFNGISFLSCQFLALRGCSGVLASCIPGTVAISPWAPPCTEYCQSSQPFQVFRGTQPRHNDGLLAVSFPSLLLRSGARQLEIYQMHPASRKFCVFCITGQGAFNSFPPGPGTKRFSGLATCGGP